MAKQTLDEILRDMRSMIERNVRTGFEPLDEIVTTAAEVFGEDTNEDLRPHAEQFAREAMEALEREQTTWERPTDCDRLDAAFEELKRSGILARHHYTCCGTCGAYEMGMEMEDRADRGVPARGYTFYDVQGTEGAADDGVLCLSYGAWEPSDEAQVAIGHEVAATLARHGLDVSWDGDLGRRIVVTLDWKRWPPREGEPISDEVVARVQAKRSQHNIFRRLSRGIRRLWRQ